MITNLVAAVSVFFVTNTTKVVTGWDSYESAPCPGQAKALENGTFYGCLVNHTRGVGPNAKTITTEVKKVTVYKFEGAVGEVKTEEVVSSKSTYWVRQWSEVPKPELGVSSDILGTLVLTNIVITNIWNVIQK